MPHLFPVFLKLSGRAVLLVGGGTVATSKLAGLRDAGARVTVVSPGISAEIAASGVRVRRRKFLASDLNGQWLVVSAATPDVNRRVARAADRRRIFVNAVDDPPNASVYLGGVLRWMATMAILTDGVAPASPGCRAAPDVPLADLRQWMMTANALADVACGQRPDGRAPMAEGIESPKGASLNTRPLCAVWIGVAGGGRDGEPPIS
jgi:uroporphyrin-III C-methyltransferase/precorrin-2 dehydrogenase/sirohydrochlorin ferrochelatase